RLAQIEPLFDLWAGAVYQHQADAQGVEQGDESRNQPTKGSCRLSCVVVTSLSGCSIFFLR
ncbi:MAG: hypothetical protein AB2814_07180, partial [Candidatus Sedimenticola endophacoides]